MQTIPIERAHAPSAAEFEARFLSANLPVVLTGLMDTWQASASWTLDFFRERFGAMPTQMRGSDDEAEVFFGGVGPQRTLLNEYFDLIEHPVPGRRTPYLGNLSFNDPQAGPVLAPLRADFAFPAYFPEMTGQDIRLWIGGAGQASTIHNDSYHNLNAQVRGIKTFLLFAPDQYPCLYTEPLTPYCWVSRLDPQSPDLDRYPLYAKATGWTATLQPGEILYIPKFWWHYVRSTTLAVNINLWAYTPQEQLWQQDVAAAVP
jgi:hypothetical protein